MIFFIKNLFSLLRDAKKLGLCHVISWEENGKSFKVHQFEKFSTVLKNYSSCKMSYKSFKNKLIDRGFKCSERKACAVYEHPSFVQGKKNVFELDWNNEGVKYKEVFFQSEKEFSAYNFDHANTESLLKNFDIAEQECKNLLEQKLPLPAYDQCLKASHIFNLLDARGVIAVAERTGYINRIRELAKGAGSGWLENQDK